MPDEEVEKVQVVVFSSGEDLAPSPGRDREQSSPLPSSRGIAGPRQDDSL